MIRHLSRVAGLLLALVLGLVTYQNCSPMTAYDLGSFDGSSFTTASIIRDADFSWSMRQSTAVFNRFDRATHWPSMQAAGVQLYPPVLLNSDLLDTDSSGLKEVSGGGVFLRMNPDARMSASVADTSELAFDEFTIVLLVKDVKPPLDVQQPVRLFDMVPADGSGSGRVVLDVTTVNGGADVNMGVFFSANDYTIRNIFVRPAKAKGVLAIAMRVTRDLSQMTLAVNGELTSQPIDTRGTLAALGRVPRNFILHTTPGEWGSQGSFLVGEIGIYKKALSDLDLKRASGDLALLYDGMVDIPIPTATPIVIGTPTPTPTATPVAEVTGAQLYKDNCAQCHGQLAESVKRGKTVAQISSAISSIGDMAGLASLTQAERKAIADALQ